MPSGTQCVRFSPNQRGIESYLGGSGADGDFNRRLKRVCWPIKAPCVIGTVVPTACGAFSFFPRSDRTEQ